jgi:hypothetical protein
MGLWPDQSIVGFSKNQRCSTPHRHEKVRSLVGIASVVSHFRLQAEIEVELAYNPSSRRLMQSRGRAVLIFWPHND